MPPQNHKQPRGWSVEWFTLRQFGTIAMFRCIRQYLLPSKDCCGLLLRPLVRSVLNRHFSCNPLRFVSIFVRCWRGGWGWANGLSSRELHPGAPGWHAGMLRRQYRSVKYIFTSPSLAASAEEKQKGVWLTYLCGVRIKLVGISLVVVTTLGILLWRSYINTGLWNYEWKQSNKDGGKEYFRIL